MDSPKKNLFDLASGSLDNFLTRAEQKYLKAINGLTIMLFGTMIIVTVLAAIAANVSNGAASGIARFLIMMVWFAVLIISYGVLFNPRTVATVAGFGMALGVPADGDAFQYAEKLLKRYAKVAGLWLIWSGMYALTLCAFPFLVGSWSPITIVPFALVLLGIVVSYALATGMMVEGPWHKPVIWAILGIMVIAIGVGVPKEWYSATGPLTSASIKQLVKDSAQKADELRSKCVDKLAKTGELYNSEQAEVLCPSLLKKTTSGSSAQVSMTDTGSWWSIWWSKFMEMKTTDPTMFWVILFVAHIPVIWFIKWLWDKNKKKDDADSKNVAAKKDEGVDISYKFMTESALVLAIILGVYSWAYGEPIWLQKIHEQVTSHTKGDEATMPATRFLTSEQAGNMHAYVVFPKDHPHAGKPLPLEIVVGLLERIRKEQETRTIGWDEEVLRIKAPDDEYRLKQTICTPPMEYNDGRMYSKCNGNWSKGGRTGTYELTYNSTQRIAVFDSDAGPIRMEFR